MPGRIMNVSFLGRFSGLVGVGVLIAVACAQRERDYADEFSPNRPSEAGVADSLTMADIAASQMPEAGQRSVSEQSRRNQSSSGSSGLEDGTAWLDTEPHSPTSDGIPSSVISSDDVLDASATPSAEPHTGVAASESTAVTNEQASSTDAEIKLDNPCSTIGLQACNGAAQDQLLICSQGSWQTNGLCRPGEHCDRRSGRCAMVPDACVNAKSDVTYCEGLNRMECGEDLLGVTLETCLNWCDVADGAAMCTAGTETGTSQATTMEAGTVSEVWTPGPVVVDPRNLLVGTNADCEGGRGEWTVLGGSVLVVSDSAAHTGAKGMLSQGRTQSWEGPTIELVGLLKPGRQYVASGWVRSEDGSGQPFHIVRKGICVGDGGVVETDDSEIYVQLASAYTSGDWVQLVSAPFTLPTCHLQTFAIYFEGPAPGKSFYLDDVSVVPADGGRDAGIIP